MNSSLLGTNSALALGCGVADVTASQLSQQIHSQPTLPACLPSLFCYSGTQKVLLFFPGTKTSQIASFYQKIHIPDCSILSENPQDRSMPVLRRECKRLFYPRNLRKIWRSLLSRLPSSRLDTEHFYFKRMPRKLPAQMERSLPAG